MDYYLIFVILTIAILVPGTILAYYLLFKIVISDWKEYKDQKDFDSKMLDNAYNRGYKAGYEACQKDVNTLL